MRSTFIFFYISINILMLFPVAAQQGIQNKTIINTPDYVLKGELTIENYQTYVEVPFEVPIDIKRLTIEVSYSGKDQRTTIDLGLEDPKKFRGWSGGSKNKITLSMEDATPGYLPGELPSGKWKLLLGVPNIRKGIVSKYEASIYLEKNSAITEFFDKPINSKEGWYRGDLHMHTGNSDGNCLSQSGQKIPCPVYRTVEAAAERGLDFIAITEHNATSHANSLRELQTAFDKMLLVAGREITTFYGHANVYGPTDFIDFRMSDSSSMQAKKWMDVVNSKGGIVSINHAGVPSGEACMGCGWQIEDLPNGTVSSVEIINGGIMKVSGSADSPFQGWKQWYKMLNSGQYVTAIGGSDNHTAESKKEIVGAIGYPTTVIFMKELSVKGMIDGIRSGRVFIDIEGKSDRFIDIFSTNGNEEAKMGEKLNITSKNEIQLTVSVEGALGASIEFIVDGALQSEMTQSIKKNKEIVKIDWQYVPGSKWIHVKIRDENGKLILVSNPIYLVKN
ncbi:CehA/McbA family metallohydrolase [Flavobacterium sp. DSR3-2]|uniref:CehA/McbA family metallohydrolase n=1 Tax=Flavobacterium sp. DSR3-2 TaxID=2804634 RepID=UPI003CFA96DE